MAELILALDLPEKERALALVGSLGDSLSWVKVGMELFTGCGPSLIEELKARNLSVFLDLKFFDIPNTVERAVTRAAEIGADILTVHCLGGSRMLAGARRGRTGKKPLLFGVTVLTSMGPGEIPGVTADPSDFVKDLAALAQASELDGIVCSPQEVSTIKKQYPALRCLCPGIRPSWAAALDQRRIATPAEAVARGADFLVVGRPILSAQDPRAALEKILEEMASS